MLVIIIKLQWLWSGKDQETAATAARRAQLRLNEYKQDKQKLYFIQNTETRLPDIRNKKKSERARNVQLK